MIIKEKGSAVWVEYSPREGGWKATGCDLECCIDGKEGIDAGLAVPCKKTALACWAEC